MREGISHHPQQPPATRPIFSKSVAGKSKIITLAAVIIGVFAIWWIWIRPERHVHCIKAASLHLDNHAQNNGGIFPASERGWGDALLLMASDKSDLGWLPLFVGVGDDGSYLKAAISTGEDVDETQCTRIYVQGLNQESNPSIALLFDRHSVKGGDHFHGLPGQKPLREVITVGRAFMAITDDKWPEFVRQQRELLRADGFSEKAIADVFGPESR